MLRKRRCCTLDTLNEIIFQLINSQALTIKISSNKKCYTNFLFSQLSGPRPWYALLHTHNDLETNFDCVVFTIASPEGNRISAHVTVYD
jgi:hypothetical protein